DGLAYLGAPLGLQSFPHLPDGTVYYIDNFGNIKLNVKHADILAQHKPGTALVASTGQTVCDVVVGDVGFSLGEGVVGLTSGSSGWGSAGGTKEMFAEIFLRGGRAENHFQGVKPGDQVLAMKRSDLERVIETLKSSQSEVSEQLDLYSISEARIMQMLARAKLIRGFDTSALQAALGDGTLVQKLTG
ncbi:MAG TPA: hypothetical protein VEF76_13300, partial [Patescibacteria group bacterium]|nr:hypothetical protein [Patescibacteria group bacterium]